ncbi:MAG TPA: LysR family transcriptional regulator [Edaphobacter sp.]|jgi:DNA-binding transcriptional LysR family regulator|nr:LysR family transcriptional regulator [Edaphobacter sp.]
MRWKQLRQIDLNLLVAFSVFAEELSVTAAAKRLLLSQSAASRTLQRLQALFQDDLLVRGARGYQLTPTGTRLQAELNRLLPELEKLIGRAAFDPVIEHTIFRLTGPDNACSALGPLLCQQVLRSAPGIEFHFVPWTSDALIDLDRGRLDLVLSNDEVLVPAHLRAQTLFRVKWYCIVARDAKWSSRLSLQRYLSADHLTVSVLDGVQTIPDKRLAALGLARRSAIRVPYFGAALECLSQTNLVLTATSGIAQIAKTRPDLRVLEAPAELKGFAFQAIWHPRLTSDPAHSWLRQTIFRLSSAITL